MANANDMNAEHSKLQGILAAYLTSRKEETAAGPHLDQDTLAAFTEGVLNERESMPIVSHLADCSFCRHSTTELVRLDLEIGDEPVPARAYLSDSKPSSISEVLTGLFEKIFGNSENAVFAHQDRKDEEDDVTDTSEKKD